ncbi:MAG: ribonuclease Z [Candidatus Bathyarchaeota archaeon]|jgi:ribonuclease Z|nr:ribonuclease Z [Candidatus Bathyarchaeota archaeon]
MSLNIIFLGTAGSVPTPKRSLPSILIQRKGEQIMFDCGEGVQRQMIKAKAGFHKKMKIFITHMHGDHVLGLPGLLQTMALLDRERKLDIYGPLGIKRFLESIRETVQFVLTFPVEVHEIQKTGIICEEEEYYVQAVWANHVIPGLSYALIEKPRPGKFYTEKAKALGVPEGPLWSKLQHGHKIKLSNGRIIKPEDVTGPPRPGRKIVYTGDTRPFKSFTKFAAGADLLIHDATLDDEMVERAEEDGHSTPEQAARNAKKAKVKQLILTHVSARYGDASILLEQARKIFKNTKVAEDFMKIEIPLSDV